MTLNPELSVFFYHKFPGLYAASCCRIADLLPDKAFAAGKSMAEKGYSNCGKRHLMLGYGLIF
jgi:hypothetical protein